MNSVKPSRIVLVLLGLLVLVLLFSSNGPTASLANAPQFSVSLYPTVAYQTTTRVTLHLTNLLGVTPPSARWYGPDGESVGSGCKGGQVSREYERVYGSLVATKDYFYVSGCNREPGTYRVTVGDDVNRTFTVKAKTYKSYVPIASKPYAESGPPAAFVKTSPADGATEQPLSVTLDWEGSAGAESYAYCYDTTDDGACSTWTDTGADSKADITGLAINTTYYWQARATNTLGETYADGDSTAFWSFTTIVKEAEPSEMVQVAAGDFEMGCDLDHNGGESCTTNQLPLHTVTLDAYYIEKTEVTNFQYAACVTAGECTAPADTSSDDRTSYYGDPTYNQYPVVHVTWQQAVDYCEWLGRRLPTEAEWERAARGTTPRSWPWGDNAPTCDLANYSPTYGTEWCVGDTDLVGARPGGASPTGALDMAGNVREWVHDWFDKDYYATSPPTNPQGPDTGDERVARGGHFNNQAAQIMTSRRNYSDSEEDYLGFRCAADTAP